MSNKIKIVIVDDHQIVIDGLKVLLLKNMNIKIIGEVNNSEQLFNFLKKDVPDIIILDLILPKANGIEIIKTLLKSYSKIKIIVYTGNAPDDMIVDSLKAGALGVLLKNSSQKEIIKAIYEVYEGNQYFGEKITNTLIEKFIINSKNKDISYDNKDVKLSDREIEVVRLFAKGYSYKEIAYELNISIYTVESHKKNILNKLELKSIIDLVKYAIKNNIIEL